MKRHLSDIHIARAITHPHLPAFLHRTHERAVKDSWTVKHPALLSLILTCLIAGLIAGYLIMFNAYQTTGVWSLFGS